MNAITVVIVISAAMIGGCSGLDKYNPQSPNFTPIGQIATATINHRGTICAELAYAKQHEAIRSQKNPSAYDLAMVSRLPGCEESAATHEHIHVFAYVDGFAQVSPWENPGSKFWLPARMIQP